MFLFLLVEFFKFSDNINFWKGSPPMTDTSDPIVGQCAQGMRTLYGQPGYDLFMEEVKKAEQNGGEIDLCGTRDAVISEVDQLKRRSVIKVCGGRDA